MASESRSVICVIADDFTGAAEIGGVALRYGLTAEVQRRFVPRPSVDVICLDTGTRSSPTEVASRRVAWAVQQCWEAGIEVFFKKVDSVLRGPVAAELAGMMAATGRERVLLAPANPSLGRTIWDRRYFVHGTPLDESDFGRDPEYPARTAEVVALVASPLSPAVHVLEPYAEMPSCGIILAQARSHEDVKVWASRLESSILPAGAAEFFAAFLEWRGYSPVTVDRTVASRMRSGRSLFVVGSRSGSSHVFCLECERHGVPVIRIPLELFGTCMGDEPWITDWVRSALEAFGKASCVVLAIDRPEQPRSGPPQHLSGCMATVAQRVLFQHMVDAIFVEGGATATQLINQLGWASLRVRRELAPGVICLRPVGVDGPLLTMKPGSYVWPENIMPWVREAQPEQSQ